LFGAVVEGEEEPESLQWPQWMPFAYRIEPGRLGHNGRGVGSDPAGGKDYLAKKTGLLHRAHP